MLILVSLNKKCGCVVESGFANTMIVILVRHVFVNDFRLIRYNCSRNRHILCGRNYVSPQWISFCFTVPPCRFSIGRPDNQCLCVPVSVCVMYTIISTNSWPSADAISYTPTPLCFQKLFVTITSLCVVGTCVLQHFIPDDGVQYYTVFLRSISSYSASPFCLCCQSLASQTEKWQTDSHWRVPEGKYCQGVDTASKRIQYNLYRYNTDFR